MSCFYKTTLGLYEVAVLTDCACSHCIINVTAIKLVDLKECSCIFIQELSKISCATNKIMFCLSMCWLINLKLCISDFI